MEKSEIHDTLSSKGFVLKRETKKTEHFTKGELSIYVKVKEKKQPLVVHPDNNHIFTSLTAIPGVRTDRPLKYYHNNTIRKFPERFKKGKTSVKYGIAFSFDDTGALNQFLEVLENGDQPSILKDLNALDPDQDPPPTTRRVLQEARVGQGKFRDDLIDDFNGSCPVTGIAKPELLRASHIKPWRDSDDQERLDRHNGLLLATHVDALFDAGFVSFDDDGSMIFSNLLDPEEISIFNLAANQKIDGLSDERQHYLQYHRKHCLLPKTDGRPA